MLWAINKKIYEDSIAQGKDEKEAQHDALCCSVLISTEKKEILSKENIILPEYKEFYGFNRFSREVLKEQKWTYVKGYVRKDEMRVRDFFTPSEKGAAYRIYNSPIDEGHHIAQDILLASFLDGALRVKYNDVMIPVNCFNILKRSAIQYIEQSRKMYGNTLYKNERHADFLVEFNSYNPTFGRGIVIEIANTETDKSLMEKQHDWNCSGFSYISVGISVFNLDAEEIVRPYEFDTIATMDYFKLKEIDDLEKYKADNKELKEILQKHIAETKMLNCSISSTTESRIADRLKEFNAKLNAVESSIASQETAALERMQKRISESDAIVKKVNDLSEYISNKQINIDTIKEQFEKSYNEYVTKIQNITEFAERRIGTLIATEISKVDFPRIASRAVLAEVNQSSSEYANILKRNLESHINSKITELMKIHKQRMLSELTELINHKEVKEDGVDKNTERMHESQNWGRAQLQPDLS